MIRTAAILLLLAATVADAQLTTTVKRIRLEHATEPELAASTLEFGHVVVNEDNLADVRVFDGATPGGVRVGSDWWTNNMLSAWGGLSRVDIEALVALSIPHTEESDPAWTSASGSVVYATTPGYTAAVEQAATAYGWGDHGEAGYLTDASTWSEHPATQSVSLAENSLTNVGSIWLYDAADDADRKFELYDSMIRLRGTPAWQYIGDFVLGGSGTNLWLGRIADAEANRIASLPAAYPVGTTNFFLRPDGGTNTVSFDETGNMIVAVDGTPALTVRTNGNLGVKNSGSGTYAIYVTGDIYATSRMRALEFRASDASTYFLDPNGMSMLASATFDGSLTVTQGVARIILPTSTNGLVSGTLWNDGGTVKVMP